MALSAMALGIYTTNRSVANDRAHQSFRLESVRSYRRPFVQRFYQLL